MVFNVTRRGDSREGIDGPGGCVVQTENSSIRQMTRITEGQAAGAPVRELGLSSVRGSRW